ADPASCARTIRSCPAALVILAAAVVSAPAALVAQTPAPPPTPGLALQSPQEPSPLSGALPKPALAAPAVPAPASGARIAQIAVEGGKTVTSETIGFYLGIKVGDAYDPSLL